MSKLIVIEGLDGSGKATQSERLVDFISKTQKVQKISFPNYEHKSSTLVKMYLEGEVGSLEEVNTFAASSFYSLDRYISFATIWGKSYKDGVITVADRYTTSNFSHQTTKLPQEKWDEYIEWLEDYEYNKLCLPKPDLVIYLDMHPTTSRKLMMQRYKDDKSKLDIHEQNMSYLLECRAAALYCAEKLGWRVVKCNDDNLEPLSLDVITEKITSIYNEVIG